MGDRNLLGPWIRRFLLEHLVVERNFSRNTQLSYRDTLTLLLPFASVRTGTPLDRMTVAELAPDTVRAFLQHVESERGCGAATRNLRLSTIHSLARFIGMHSPEHLGWCTELRCIAFKKSAKAAIGYLDKPEMDALLQQPDRRTPLGARDHALLLFLYNSGARADEAAQLTVGCLCVGTSASVRILGKGNKLRICPLWPETATALRALIAGRDLPHRVFRGRTGEALTRFGVHRIVTSYATSASSQVPTLQAKRVSPHTIRHTAAVHLLRSGVDINTIRAWLGHVSLDTTHVYAEVDLEMKAKALACLDTARLPQSCLQPKTLPSLMQFLQGL